MRAKRFLMSPFSGHSLAKRRKILESLIYLLSEAKGEAESALRGRSGESPERNMLKFLELLCDAAEAAYAMVQHEGLMEHDKNFLKAFMGDGAQDVLKTEVGYQRSANEILKGMRNMVTAVNEAYKNLMTNDQKSCSEDGRSRYRRAYKVA